MPRDLSPDDIHLLFEERRADVLRDRFGGVAGIAKALGVDTQSGHKSKDLQTPYGRNVLPEPKSASFLQLLWLAYQDKTLILLTVAAVVSLLVGVYEQVVLHEKGWIEGVAIICAIVIVVLVNAVNDFQREKQFQMLSTKVKDRQVTVLQDGQPQQVSVYDVCVGDVLLFEPGELVPADGLLLAGHKVAIDESGVTGESDTVNKDDEHNPWLLSGTKVIDGSGRMLVLAVGLNSTQGRLVQAMHEAPGPTPLQQKLDILADQIAKAGAAAALFMVLSLTAKYVAVHAVRGRWPSTAKVIQHLLHILIQAVTVVVVAVPEGLPMAVTMALAFATTKMLQDHNLVRVMASCETMGAATTICSDKTGTMTENKMTVVKQHLVQGAARISEHVKTVIVDSIFLNSTAFHSASGWIGSKTEVALLEFCRRTWSRADYLEQRRAARIVQRIPFSSDRKFMATAVEAFDADGRPVGRLFVKGASEVVLGKCASYYNIDGEVEAVSAGYIEEQLQVIADYANAALRTIGLAVRDVVDTTVFAELYGRPEMLEAERGLVWIGVVGIEDPLREGVREAVMQCQRAGITVRMVTGDNIDTAKAIAAKANILQPSGVALEGAQFRQLDEQEMNKLLPRLQVLARSSPIDKQILVKRLRQQGQVVAVTGDGTNDGPALKAANVGFSMGIAGTEVAKEASSIVLMDDNFTSIVKAVSWGRAVNEAVRRFLQFQLTVNLAAVVTAAVSALIDASDESILTAVQMLWVNLIMDTFAALALATDPPSDDVLDRPPDRPDSGLLGRDMKVMIVGQSVSQIAIILTLQLVGQRFIADTGQLRTFIFNTFIFLQLFNELNCRSLGRSVNFFKGLSRNHYFPAIWLGTVAVQVAVVQFGGQAFGTVPIGWKLWAVAVLIGTTSAVLGVLIRLCLFRKGPTTVVRDNHSIHRWHATVRHIQRSRAFFNAIRKEHQSKNLGPIPSIADSV